MKVYNIIKNMTIDSKVFFKNRNIDLLNGEYIVKDIPKRFFNLNVVGVLISSEILYITVKEDAG